MSDQTIERRLTELRTKAALYAKAAAEKTYLEEFRKSKLAILQKKYMKDFDSVAAQEREARADPEYVDLLNALKFAVEEEQKLFWELQIARMGAGLWQTQQANQRAERRAYGA